MTCSKLNLLWPSDTIWWHRTGSPLAEIKAETKWPPFRRRHFQSHFVNENVRISIKFSLKFVPKGPINNIPSLVQIMALRRPGASHYLNQRLLIYWHMYASLGLNELSNGFLPDSTKPLNTWTNADFPTAARSSCKYLRAISHRNIINMINKIFFPSGHCSETEQIINTRVSIYITATVWGHRWYLQTSEH